VARSIAFALLLLLAQASPQQPPRFRTETNFVRVDVYATKGGVPVSDLTRQDFEVFEDEAPQSIESFEHITIAPAGSRAGLVDPASPSEANQLAVDPRRRVFVIFLDTHNVPSEAARALREPLVGLLQRMLGDDDLVALMTPDMRSDQITFARKTAVIEQGLLDNAFWGRADTITPDARERLYQDCYPPANDRDSVPSQVAQEMSRRRKERVVLESLHDLVHRMGAMREGRTAVITITDGWLLYGPDLSLTKHRRDNKGNDADPLPGAPVAVGVGRGGSLARDPKNETTPNDRSVCERELMALAMLDDDQYFRMLYGEANRANVSFYTLDPRGLVVFDAPLSADTPPTPDVDRARVEKRTDTLHRLALNTDGLALLNSNDLRRQLNRIADDLTTYYLLGYRSTNGRLDGKYRSIKVRSTRPGVEIRARHGYTAATAEEAANARAAANLAVPDAQAALKRALAAIEPGAPTQGAARGPGEPLVFHRGPQTGNQVQPAAGRVFPRSDRLRLELEAAAGAPGWTGALLDRNGNKTPVPVTAGERTDAATGQRWLTADITLAPLGAGDYVVELTVTQGTEQKKTLVGIRVTQ
jgi:VWFA-related protein